MYEKLHYHSTTRFHCRSRNGRKQRSFFARCHYRGMPIFELQWRISTDAFCPFFPSPILLSSRNFWMLESITAPQRALGKPSFVVVVVVVSTDTYLLLLRGEKGRDHGKREEKKHLLNSGRIRYPERWWGGTEIYECIVNKTAATSSFIRCIRTKPTAFEWSVRSRFKSCEDGKRTTGRWSRAQTRYSMCVYQFYGLRIELHIICHLPECCF